MKSSVLRVKSVDSVIAQVGDVCHCGTMKIECLDLISLNIPFFIRGSISEIFGTKGQIS